MRAAVVTALLALLFTGVARAEFPAPTGTVTDAANILSVETESALRDRIAKVEQTSTAELAVAVVPSLDGMTVEDYANRLFRQWGIGRKGADNGVLLLVAPSEHKVRIEVGYGLEGILPDGLAGEIIRNQALPAFRNDRYDDGIRDTVERLATIVEANHVLTAEERAAIETDASTSDRPPAVLTTPFFGLFIALGALALGIGLRTKTVFPLIWGGLFGGIPLVMALIPFFNAALWIILPLGAGMFVLGWVKGAQPSWKQAVRGAGNGATAGKKGKRRSAAADDSDLDTGTGWTMGGGSSSSSSSSSGSSDSSSSSSFGGGSSGGGGASGSW